MEVDGVVDVDLETDISVLEGLLGDLRDLSSEEEDPREVPVLEAVLVVVVSGTLFVE